MPNLFARRPEPGSMEAQLLQGAMAANVDEAARRAAFEARAAARREEEARQLRAILDGLSRKQLRILRAMPLRRTVGWRRLYRTAKVQVAGPDFAQLPFSLARCTMSGGEYLTRLGQEAKQLLEGRAK